jgi:hypothetical protein
MVSIAEKSGGYELSQWHNMWHCGLDSNWYLKNCVIGGTQSMHGRNRKHIRVRSIIFENSAKILNKSNFDLGNHS